MSDNVLYSNETIEDFISEYTVSDVLWMFLSGVKNPWYPLINPNQYKQALSEFIKYGTFIKFPIEKIMDWFHIIVRNTCILSSMTTLAGHDYYFPTEDIKEIIFDSEEDFNQFKQELIDDESEMPAEVFGSEYATSDISDDQVCWKKLESMGFYEWCSLPDGSQGISDYGIDPLFNIMQEFDPVIYAEELIVLVNRCLDVTHQRGDLASAFIEGGSNSLTKISNESKNIFPNEQLNEEINHILKLSGVQLNEEIVYAESPYEGALENIILKNPTRKELKDNNMTLCRWAYDDDGNYYFWDAYEMIHQSAEDKLSEKDIYAEDLAGFYNLYNNTFYARDDYSDDEEKEIYRQSVEADLKKQPFLVKNFGNFKYDNFPNEFPEIQESINEEINYATSDNQGLLKNIILKNPSRKELKDNDMTTCRIVKDWNGNYYFADSYDFIHTEIVDELFKQKISAIETNLFYNLYNNTFYIRVDHLEDNEIDEYVQKICQELNNSYYMKKEFGNFNCDITYGEL